MLTGAVSMPDVSDLFNMNTLNVLLDAQLGGPGNREPRAYPYRGLWLNLVRLTDKALREYDAARAELLDYSSSIGSRHFSPVFRAVDHLENCIGATHRAVLNARALRVAGFAKDSPMPTAGQEDRLRLVRNRIEHAEERLVDGRIKPAQFHALRPFDHRVDIGDQRLTYRDLERCIRRMYAIIEKMRGPSTQGGALPANARLRTAVPPRRLRGSALRTPN
jgi:hypothetical protein